MYPQNSEQESVICEIKHLRLSNAIEDLSSVSLALNELKRRISGPTPTEVGSKALDRPEPSLESVLNGGADRINKRREELFTLISGIEKTLFG